MGSEILNDFNSRIIDFNRSLPKDESQPIEPKASVVPVDATASEVRAEYGKCRAAPQGRLPDQGRSYMQAFERQQADLTTLGVSAVQERLELPGRVLVLVRKLMA
jgi:hypothetical protein